MGFNDLSLGMQMRDVIDKMIASGIERLRPRYRYAVVVSFVRSTGKCTVIFNGDSNPVIVNMGAIQPSAAGQTVRVEGIGTDKFITDVVGTPNPGIPAGVILASATLVAPVGFLNCDGVDKSRTLYSNLFAAIGTSYGAGDGTTTFGIPNVSGRAIVGYDSTQTEFDTLGEKGGTKTHTLTTTEMPSHTHALSEDKWISGSGAASAAKAYGSPTANTGYSTDATGGGTAHNNLQPYISLPFIIKT